MLKFVSALFKPEIFVVRADSFQEYEILDWTKLEAFADNKLNVSEMVISVFDKEENMLVTRIFFFSQNVFKSPSPLEAILSQDFCGEGF